MKTGDLYRANALGKTFFYPRRAVLMVWSIAVVIMMSGCFGNSPRGSDVSGIVKIGDHTTFSDFASMNDAARPGSPVATPQFLPELTDPTYEYVVYLNDRNGERDFISAVSSLGFKHLRTVNRAGYYLVADLKRRSTFEALWLLQSLRYVAVAEENGRVELLFDTNTFSNNFGTDQIDDAIIVRRSNPGELWSSYQIRVEEAHDISQDGDGIVVAVVDTGIDFNHPAFGDDPNMWVSGRDFISTDAINGIPYGPFDGAGKESAHGTKVAGIIATRGPSPGGSMKGVAPAVRIMPIRVLFGTNLLKPTQKEIATEDTIARAVGWAVENGADVINLSLGMKNKTQCGTPLNRALDAAWAAGVIVVAAAGNDNIVICPAGHDKVIAVGSSTAMTPSNGMPASYSGAGDGLDLLAPGGEQTRPPSTDCEVIVMGPIPGINGGHLYDCATVGTSFAAPHVTGVAALMLSHGNVRLSRAPEDVKNILHMTARSLSGTFGHNKHSGYGLLDAFLAVSARIPKVFIARKVGDSLVVAHRMGEAGEGGMYRLAGLPEGDWMLVGWSDADGSGSVSEGDFYGEIPIYLKKGHRYFDANLFLTPYTGEHLVIDY